ncbi:TetR/AcrR family transcriptional regulator [Blastococcus capsensis]|uniref:TetR/AcrR family transcriptional regulator n=1 Tax=Blastococcus capsensis TaxID=1564163 RepID=UPI0025412557|nr:TetR/AcrR family transcriptional regulator [Blastococcus capsensis]MDK3256735.1 TetR/AcrR family transcriptional regulator [Blastococcus capsensis]
MHEGPPLISEAPSTARGRATRERIVTAAAALMHQYGVAGTSLDEVRAATGTSKSQLYHYFADKSALVGAVIQRQVQQVLQAQQPELDGIDSMIALRRWRDRVVAMQRQAGAVGGCPIGRLVAELADSERGAPVELVDGFATWQRRLADGLGRMHRRGELDADPDALAAGLLAALQGGLLLAQATRSVRPLEAALDLALAGVAAHLVPAARPGPVPGRPHPS